MKTRIYLLAMLLLSLGFGAVYLACNSDEEQGGCESHAYYECVPSAGNIYWFDSCGNKEGSYERCCTGCSAGDKQCPVSAQGGTLGEGGGCCPNLGESGPQCNGVCEPKHDYYECVPSAGNIYWHDACDEPNDSYQRCCTGCSAGDKECPVPAEGGTPGEGGGCCANLGEECNGDCEPKHDYYECVPSAGNIYWHDACDEPNDSYQRCCTGCSAGDKECPVPAEGGTPGEGGGCCANLGEECNGDCEPKHDYYECVPSAGNIYWHDACDEPNDSYQRCCTGCSAGQTECPVPADENNCCPGEEDCP